MQGVQRKRIPIGPRPEVQAVTAPASTQGARVMSLTEVPARSVVLRSPAPGITEVPARSVVMHNPVPGIQQEIGTVSYTQLLHDLQRDRMREE